MEPESSRLLSLRGFAASYRDRADTGAGAGWRPQKPETARNPVPTSLYRRIRRPSYRSAAILLSILVMSAAGYISWEPTLPDRSENLEYSRPIQQPAAGTHIRLSGAVRRQIRLQSAKPKSEPYPSPVLLQEARALASGIELKAVLLRRI
jgi:hypothetical protein